MKQSEMMFKLICNTVLILVFFYLEICQADTNKSNSNLASENRLQKTIEQHSIQKYQSFSNAPHNYSATTPPGTAFQNLIEAGISFKAMDETMQTLDESKYKDDQTSPPNKKQVNPPIEAPIAIAECSGAQIKLRNFELDLISNIYRDPPVDIKKLNSVSQFDNAWYRGDVLLGGELETYKKLIDLYNSKCFESTKIVTDWSNINSIVGILTLPLNEEILVHCTAFRISANKIVTARHCITELPTSIDGSELRFSLPNNNPNNKVKVLREACTNGASTYDPGCITYISDIVNTKTINSDYVILEIEDMKTKMPRLSWSRPTEIEAKSIVLASWNSYPAISKKSAEALGQPINLQDVNSIYVSKKGYCQVAQVSNSCILHGCQSTPGSSGAPIIGWKDGTSEIKIVGIHVAAASDSPDLSGCDTSKVQETTGGHIGNVAIPLPESVVAIANSNN